MSEEKSKIFVSFGEAYFQKFIEENNVKIYNEKGEEDYEKLLDYRTKSSLIYNQVAKYLEDFLLEVKPYSNSVATGVHNAGAFTGTTTSSDAICKVKFSDLCINCGANKDVLIASGIFKNDYECPVCGANNN